MRKTTNLLIRQTSKKSSRQHPPNPQSITNTSFKSRQSSHSKKPLTSEQMQLHKQMVRAQNLTQKEQQEIQIEARKTVTKKIKMTENRIEGEIVGMLEGECARLGGELERERVENQRLKVEIERLRRNIQLLNQKLEKAFNDQTHLSKNQIDGKIQNKQLAQELTSLRNQLKRKQTQIQYLHTQKQIVVGSMKSEIQQLKIFVEKQNLNLKNLRQQKQQIEQQLQQKTKEAQLLRQNFQSKKRQWDTEKRDFQSNVKTNIEKKGQKITKYQVELQKLQQKIKQQQLMRKKAADKNKQFQKQLNQQTQIKKQLQQQITSLKKRVNDLSILKSSNNAIMNQKIQKLIQQNEKLRNQIQQLKGGIKPNRVEEKPVLFGAKDFD